MSKRNWSLRSLLFYSITFVLIVFFSFLYPNPSINLVLVPIFSVLLASFSEYQKPIPWKTDNKLQQKLRCVIALPCFYLVFYVFIYIQLNVNVLKSFVIPGPKILEFGFWSFLFSYTLLLTTNISRRTNKE